MSWLAWLMIGTSLGILICKVWDAGRYADLRMLVLDMMAHVPPALRGEFDERLRRIK